MRQYKDVNWDIFPILWIEMLKIQYLTVAIYAPFMGKFGKSAGVKDLTNIKPGFVLFCGIHLNPPIHLHSAVNSHFPKWENI